MTSLAIFLSAISIISTAIITYISFKHDVHKKFWHITFVFFVVLSVLSAIGALINQGIESDLSEKKSIAQQAEFKEQLQRMRTSDSLEQIATRQYIIDSVSSLYKATPKGIKQRHITVQYLNKIIKQIPSKEHQINVIIPTGDFESEVYAKEIINALKNRGYTNIPKNQWIIGDTGGFDTVTTFLEQSGLVNITVHPSKNTKL